MKDKHVIDLQNMEHSLDRVINNLVFSVKNDQKTMLTNLKEDSIPNYPPIEPSDARELYCEELTSGFKIGDSVIGHKHDQDDVKSPLLYLIEFDSKNRRIADFDLKIHHGQVNRGERHDISMKFDRMIRKFGNPRSIRGCHFSSSLNLEIEE